MWPPVSSDNISIKCSSWYGFIVTAIWHQSLLRWDRSVSLTGMREHPSLCNYCIFFSYRSVVCRSCLWIMRSSTSAEETGWLWAPRSGSAYPTAHGRTWRSTADAVSGFWSNSYPLSSSLSFILVQILIRCFSRSCVYSSVASASN